MFYTVLEIQVTDSGAYGVTPVVYEELSAAEAKYYTILSAAAVSTIPYHAAHIIRSDGIHTEGKVYDRRTSTEE